MESTFADLAQIGLSGPFNLSSMVIRVSTDTNGFHHLAEHSGAKFRAGSYYANYKDPAILGKIAPCCQKRTSWTCSFKPKSDSWLPTSVCVVSAKSIFMLRQEIMDTLGESEMLKKNAAGAAAVNESLFKYYFKTHQQLEKKLRGSGSTKVLDWSKEYSKAIKLELAKRAKLFKKDEAKPLLRKVAKTMLEMPVYKSLEPGMVKLQRDCQKAMLDLLANSDQEYLIDFTALENQDLSWSGLAILLYGEKNLMLKGTRQFIVLPAALAEVFIKSGDIDNYVKLEGSLEAKTLEALRVLYQPGEPGPYSNLETAFKAACLL